MTTRRDPRHRSQSDSGIITEHTTPGQRRVMFRILQAIAYVTLGGVVVGVVATHTELLSPESVESVGFLSEHWKLVAIVSLVSFVFMTVFQETVNPEYVPE